MFIFLYSIFCFSFLSSMNGHKVSTTETISKRHYNHGGCQNQLNVYIHGTGLTSSLFVEKMLGACYSASDKIQSIVGIKQPLPSVQKHKDNFHCSGRLLDQYRLEKQLSIYGDNKKYNFFWESYPYDKALSELGSLSSSVQLEAGQSLLAMIKKYCESNGIQIEDLTLNLVAHSNGTQVVQHLIEEIHKREEEVIINSVVVWEGPKGGHLEQVLPLKNKHDRYIVTKWIDLNQVDPSDNIQRIDIFHNFPFCFRQVIGQFENLIQFKVMKGADMGQWYGGHNNFKQETLYYFSGDYDSSFYTDKVGIIEEICYRQGSVSFNIRNYEEVNNSFFQKCIYNKWSIISIFFVLLLMKKYHDGILNSFLKNNSKKTVFGLLVLSILRS